MDHELLTARLHSQSDVTSISRRIRLLGALAELAQKQREDAGKAVTRVARHLIDLRSESEVQLTIRKDGNRADLLITFKVAASPAGDENVPDNTLLREVASLVDEVESDTVAEEVSYLTLRVSLPPTFRRLSAEETKLWRRMLDQNSLEDAIVVATRRSRSVEADADRMRERHQLRDELEYGHEDSESLFSLIASETDNSVVVMESDGRISWVNKSFVRMTGYSGDEIHNKELHELLGGPDSSGEVLHQFRDALRNGHRFNDELLLYRRDGRSYWTHFTLTPIRHGDGQVSRWIAIGTDVTQQRQAIDALAASKEAAESANRAKSDFLANMSHEIRTPLNAIIGMTELSLGTELTREQREYLSTVRISAESLLDLLNDVLDLSKIEAGRMVLDETDFNIADLLRDTVRALAVKAHSKGIELVCHVPQELPQWLNGDAVRLRQILVNLIGNAIKFTSEGEVVVDVQQQWANQNNISLHFCVRDTGVGISEDKLEQIFESFQQADTSTTREFGGTGLGLTITSELLNLMGGRMWVESTRGVGSLFHFSLTLPLVPEPPPAREFDASLLLGRHALIVDDNETNRRILKEMLGSWQISCHVVATGPAAIEEISRQTREEEPYDLVLLDAMMPGMDGFSVAEEVQRRDDLKVGTVMMLSSADQPEARVRCRELEIHSYVPKPITPSTLFDALITAMGEAPSVGVAADPPDTSDRPLKILVADDHEANRQLAVEVLQRRNHVCEQAENGRDAVTKWKEASPQFDVVLMDIQMPELDGFAATQEIREHEKGRHTPIVALTAHALKEDRERCLANGFDDYLAKPIRPKELVNICMKAASLSKESSITEGLDPPISDVEATDFNYALERLDGEEDLLRIQMEYFLNDGPELISELRTGVTTETAKDVERAAHRLKGLLAGYGRSRSSQQAATLEQDAADGSVTRSRHLVDQLDADVQHLVAGIREYLKVRA